MKRRKLRKLRKPKKASEAKMKKKRSTTQSQRTTAGHTQSHRTPTMSLGRKGVGSSRGTNQRRMKRMMTPRTKTLRLTVRTRRITRRMSRRKKRKKRSKKSLMKYYSLQDYLEIASSKLPSQQSSKWSSDSCTELWPSRSAGIWVECQ